MSEKTHPDHIQIPHLRPIQPVPINKDGQQLIALRDPAMVSQQTMVIPPQVVPVLQHFRGEEGLDTLSEKLKIDIAQLAALAEGLDKVGLLWGPTCEKLEQDLKDKIAAKGAYPAGAAATLDPDAETGKKKISQWLAETEDPEIVEQVLGIIAPHLDYERGWPNYASAYRCLDAVERPDRVVILGTNHFGLGDGVVLNPFGFDSPMGRTDTDKAVVEGLISKLGDRVVVDQLDHLPEHSIQLHLPWIIHRWGDVPVVAALIPDPLQPMLEDDDARVTREDFVAALKETLPEVGGSTFYVSSADLSHVGPQFGEPRPVDDQRKHDVELHDREMMAKFISADPEEFISAMKWSNNSTRWCSIGNMTAMLELAHPEAVELIDYRQACDEEGRILVSSAAMALI